MSTEIKELSRRPSARHKDVVLGCIEERLLIMPLTDELEPHRARLMELLDELRRSLGKKESE